MRHLLASLSLLLVLAVAAAGLDALARRSARPGLILAWTYEPGTTLASLPQQTRIVNSWWSGHLLQLHVESLREFTGPLAAARLSLRLPEPGVALAGCS